MQKPLKTGGKVVVAAVIKQGSRYLIAQRGKQDDLYGKWEFPGGKLEPGETEQECLARELHEEFGLESVKVGAYVCTVAFEHNGNQMHMHAYYVTSYQGAFTLFEHKQIKWITTEEFSAYEFPEPDLPIIQALMQS